MEKAQRKKLSITLMILGLMLCFFSGTLAYWTWEINESQKTNISLEVQGAKLDIEGGNVEKTGMYPTKLCGGEAALIGDVAEVTAINITSSDMKAIIKIRASLDVAQGTFTSEKKEKINWAIVDTSDGSTCETTSYRGTMSSVTTNTDLETGIEFIISPGQTINKNYQIYAWLDWSYEHQNQGTDITDPTQNLKISVKFSPASELIQLDNDPVAPVLDDGMIPVKISADGVATTVSNTDSTWYNYGNKEWANVVLVKESGTQTRSYYKSNTGVTVAESDILAYYVWIPRYKYRIWTLTESSAGSEQPIDILFESIDYPVTQGSKVGEFITHPAFIWDGNLIPGIWVGKFETTGDETNPTILPNNQATTNTMDVIDDFETSLIFAGGTLSEGVVTFAGSSVYGLTSNTDSHMMKNTEWGAVAYLSHSIYGINSEIYINNSSDHYTGRSGGNVGGSVNTVSTQFGSGSTSLQYNSYGYYTWTGQTISSSGVIGDFASDRTLGTKASTTGNVTGIYDMSGGAYDSVMGAYGDAFTLDNKYYDKYTTSSGLTACNGSLCFGHALFETSGWYSDDTIFINSSEIYFDRGGEYIDASSSGIFATGKDTNEEIQSFRTVAIVEQ